MNLKLVQPSTIPLPEMEDFALVLCGGGAAGRWQAGVMIALAQHGVVKKAKLISGTSVGGLNTGLFTLFNDNEGTTPEFYKAIDLWESIKTNKDVYANTIDSVIDKIRAGAGFVSGAESILDPTPLHKKIDQLVQKNTLEQAADAHNIQCILSSLDLNTQIENFFTSFGDDRGLSLAEAMKKTSAIPGMFKSMPGEVKGMTHWYVDGGVAANNPFISLDLYNEVFVGGPIKKAIVVYCYPDLMTDTGVAIVGPDNKSYKAYRDALLRTVSAAMNSQEQVAETIINLMVKYAGWDVLALYPSKAPCDALDFTKVGALQDGYDYAVTGQGYSYRDKADISILDFLKRK